MAWRSSGETNTELVDNLVNNGLIHSREVEEGFRRVDRLYFVPKGCENEAYADRPIRENNIHISAPHIYCTVLEALKLIPGASLTFLNIGSGSGYLSCLVSEILGPKSIYYGIEIHEDTLIHCKLAVSQWRAQSSTAQHIQTHMHFIHGNGLNIQVNAGESPQGYDRIYVGAAISTKQLKKIRNLLSPGGIMIAPVEDDLLKVVRNTSSRPLFLSNAENEEDYDDDDCNFSAEIISGVTFAPLLSRPQVDTIVPAAKWDVSNHHLYPQSFQNAMRTILLCKNSNLIQPVEQKVEYHHNVAALLPKEVWFHILSFTTRRWFDHVNTEDETMVLKRRLAREQTNVARTRQALSDAENHNTFLQRQNDIYLQIARQFYEEVQNVIERHDSLIHLNQDLLQSTQSLLEASRDMLFPLDSHHDGDASYEMMDHSDDEDEEEEEDDDYDDDDMEEDSDSESVVNDQEIVERSSQAREEEVVSGGNSRQIRAVSISINDL